MNDIQIAKEIRAAIKQGEIERVIALIDSDPARLYIDTPFGSWLHVAASLGEMEIVKWLIQMGADVNRRGGVFDASPIKEAASYGHFDVVRYLLSVGAKLDVSEPERNPLFGAIYGGNIDIIRLLLESGIDASVRYSGRSMNDMDAAAFAEERGLSAVAELLKEWTQGNSQRNS